jgi:hypothetical protein
MPDYKISTKETKAHELAMKQKNFGARTAFERVERWIKKTYPLTYRWKLASLERFINKNL